MENIWQFSKIWPNLPAAKERYSRYDQKIIWEWPAQQHLDFNTSTVLPQYFEWRQRGMHNQYPVRYPAGFRHKRDTYCSFAENPDGTINPTPLDYIEARKKIYLPVFCRLVKQVPDFYKLQQRLLSGENLLIIEVDGPKIESLDYYRETYHGKPSRFFPNTTYNIDNNFIENHTIEVTPDNMDIMLHDRKHSFGHGYCLGLALLNWEHHYF
jgi:hypothetical protein